MRHDEKGCPGGQTGSIYRPSTCGICFACSRHGKQTAHMLTPAARLEQAAPGQWVWDCANKVPAWQQEQA